MPVIDGNSRAGKAKVWATQGEADQDAELARLRKESKEHEDVKAYMLVEIKHIREESAMRHAELARLRSRLAEVVRLGRDAWKHGFDAESSGDIAHCDALAILSGIQDDVQAAKKGKSDER